MGKRLLVPFQQYNYSQPVHPCRSCVYFFVCGDNMRVNPCEGRLTKTDINRKKKIEVAFDERIGRKMFA